MKFIFGVEGLDELLRGALDANTLLVVAGHPGSGKTTLASTICYRNALNGYKCLYISLQEDKEKLYRNMKRLGIYLEDVEGKGLLRFIKLPVTVAEESISEIYINIINRNIMEFNPSIIVVDSITPILKILKSDIKARAVLQNFFFELPKLINGLAVLIAEIPLARERIGLGDIEFIADAILVMRHSVVGRLLRRELEIRKARGAPISAAKIYFTISEGYGIKAYIPLRLAEIPSPNISNIVRLPCREIEDFLHSIYSGEAIYVSYPPHLFPLPQLLIAIAAAIINKAKLLIISYEVSSEYIWYRIAEAIKRYLKVNISIDKVKDVLKDYVVIEAYSPAAHISDELYHIALESVQRIKPYVITILGTSFTAMGNTEEYVKNYGDLILNLMLYFRKLGLTTIIFGSYQEDLYRFYTHVADIIIKTEAIKTQNGEELEHIIARKGSPTMIAKDHIFNTCLEKIAKTIYSLAEYSSQHTITN